MTMLKKVLYFPMILVIYLYLFIRRDMPRYMKDECYETLSLYWKGTIFDPRHIYSDCPHCGDTFRYRTIDKSTELVPSPEGVVTGYSISCATCDFHTGQCESEFAAAKEWNRFERKETATDRLLKVVDFVGFAVVTFVLGCAASTHPIAIFAYITGAVLMGWLSIRIGYSLIVGLYTPSEDKEKSNGKEKQETL